MAIPTDPQLAAQWHLARANLYWGGTGNPSVWDDYTGEGIRVAVYDNGVQTNHFDLDANYNASREFVWNGTTLNGQNPGDHGTFVAGIIAAEANGQDTVGVAYNAEVTGVTYGAPMNFGADYAEALFEHQINFDVINHSWGFPTFNELSQPHNGVYRAIQSAMDYVAEEGRAGLGTVVVAASSNQRFHDQGWDDVSRDANTVGAVVGDRHTITVAAVGTDGFVTNYSTPGSNILVSGFSGNLWENSATTGIVATDRTDDATPGFQNGADGWAVGNVATGAFGTSFAAPLVTGVVALMLEANPDLGWRDVREILAITARHTGSGLAAGPQNSELHDWFANGARNWNGGGHYFSEDYGFGTVDARAAVRLAETWTKQQTSANEEFRSAASFFNRTIPDATQPSDTDPNQNITFTIADGVAVENVKVYLALEHTWMQDLVITLTSPSGTTTTLLNHVSGNADVQSLNLVSNAFLGEESGGTWRINVADTVGGDVGTLRFASLDVYGSADDLNDTFYYTDGFGEAAAINVWRTFLDGGSGIDTINTAAVSTDVLIDLRGTANGAGGNSQIDNAFLRILGGVENATTGDGWDILIGSDEANVLRSGRGNDQVNAGGGNDTIEGGRGDDRLYGEAGDDRIVGGDGNDTMVGFADNDTIVSSRYGNDIAVGGTGNDTLSFETDTVGVFIDLTQTSQTFRLGNIPTQRVIGSVSYSEFENLTGGAGGDRFSGDGGINRIIGNAGNDTIDGREGNDSINGGFANYLDSRGDDGDDRIAGGAGNDHIYASLGSDTVDGGADIDTLDFRWVTNTVNADLVSGQATFFMSGSWTEPNGLGGGGWGSNNTTTFTNIENLVGGSGNDMLYGDAGANTISGGAGADRLDGRGGADRLIGGDGDDSYFVDNIGDRVSDTSGIDTIFASISQRLGAGIENLRLTGATGLTGTGNDLANLITGTNAADKLYGLGGNDRLMGNGGNDLLDGGLGADRMEGGLGNDTYYVDELADAVVEAVGGGGDTVYARASYTLGAAAEVEILRALAGSTGLTLTGNGFGNTVIGGAGNDVLRGAGGNDRLIGGLGADTFRFLTADDSSAAVRDRIDDFNRAQGDRIDLSGVFGGTLTFMDDDAFTGIGQVRVVQSGAAQYVQVNLAGDAAAEMVIAVVNSATVLGAQDFVL